MFVDTTYYRRHLPHYQPTDGTFFVTFRLTGSLPIKVVSQMKAELLKHEKEITEIKDEKKQKEQLRTWRKKYFAKFDEQLDRSMSGPLWLQEPAIADLIEKAIRFRDGSKYDLLAFCIMPNHVHLVFDLSPFDKFNSTSSYEVTNILASLKKHTALEANKLLKRSGAFWQHESYDHLVRNERELERIIAYIINNPVKAGLVKTWQEWKWSYVVNDRLNAYLDDSANRPTGDSANRPTGEST